MSTVCIDLDRYFTPPPGKLLSSGLLGSFLVILALQTFGALGRKIGVIPLAGVTYILWASTPGPSSPMPTRAIVNMPNIGQISNLPPGAVVETAVRVDRNGFSPVTFGPLPEVVRGMTAPLAEVARMTVDACFAASRQLAIQALRLDPLCSHLNSDQVVEMAGRLLRAHKRFIPRLA